MKYKTYKDFYDYYVYEDGSIWSTITNRFLKPGLMKNGYLKVVLCKDKKKYCKTVHHVVANAWFVNKDGLNSINHKNGIKTDNRVDNLEWMDLSENIILGHNKAVYSISKIDGSRRDYDSIINASRYTKVCKSNIARCCNKQRKSAGNYYWYFK